MKFILQKENLEDDEMYYGTYLMNTIQKFNKWVSLIKDESSAVSDHIA